MTTYLGGRRRIHANAEGEHLALDGGLVVGSDSSPLQGQIKLGAEGGSGYLDFYTDDGGYHNGLITGAEITLRIDGDEKVKLLADGSFRIVNNEFFKSLNAAGNADLDLIGRNASDALVLGNGLTGVLKAVSSVISAASLVNADVDNAAAIAMTKLQPYEFLAYAGSVASNVTGDGTSHTVQFGTVIKNESSQYNPATGVFTAPVTGLYLLQCRVAANDLGAANTTGLLRIVTSNRTYLNFKNPATARDAGNTASFELVALADMDAADTASVTFQVDSGAKVVDISGTTDGRTAFGGVFLG